MTTSPMDERVDLGQRMFVACSMLALVLSTVCTMLACGLHFSWLWLLVGLVYIGVALLFSEGLFKGCSKAENLAKIWASIQAPLMLVLLSVLFVAPGVVHLLGGPALVWTFLFLFAAHLLLFGAMTIGSQSMRGFFSFKRTGVVEPIPIAATRSAEECLVPLLDGTAKKIRFAEPTGIAVARLAQAVKILGATLPILAGASLIGGIFLLISRGTGWTLLLLGLVSLPTGLITLTLSDDLHFLSTVPDAMPAHLANTKTSLKTWMVAATIIAALLGLVAWLA